MQEIFIKSHTAATRDLVTRAKGSIPNALQAVRTWYAIVPFAVRTLLKSELPTSLFTHIYPADPYLLSGNLFKWKFIFICVYLSISVVFYVALFNERTRIEENWYEIEWRIATACVRTGVRTPRRSWCREHAISLGLRSEMFGVISRSSTRSATALD